MLTFSIFELVVCILFMNFGQYQSRPPTTTSVDFFEDYYYWNSSDPRRYPWLKICSDTEQYEVQPRAWCSKGVHFPGGFIPHCVCPFGLWGVKKGLCEMHTIFLLGDSRREICYDIDYKIESLIFLGDPNNVFASKAYVAPFQLNVFYEIPMDGSWTPTLLLDKPLIIHMFPINNRSIETEDGSCFPVIQPNKANVPVHIWASALGPARYRLVDKCRTPVNFGFNDLIGPNMVFVRSNLINEIPVPTRLGCTPSQVTKCNEFTTTASPLDLDDLDSSQQHTPWNHQTLYFDLAKDASDQKEKLRQSIPVGTDYSVELMEPTEGNFSTLVNEPIKAIELPILMDSEAFRKILNMSQYRILNQTVEKLQNTTKGKVRPDERRLVEDILEDILQQDADIFGPNRNDEQQHEEKNQNQSDENHDDSEEEQAGSDFLNESSDYSDLMPDEPKQGVDVVSPIENSIEKRTKRSLVIPSASDENSNDIHSQTQSSSSYVNENEVVDDTKPASSNEPLASNDGVSPYNNKGDNDPPFDFTILMAPPNKNGGGTREKRRLRRKLQKENNKVDHHILGVCEGIQTPPQCDDEEEKDETFHSIRKANQKERKHKKSSSQETTVEDIINGTRSLVNLIQRFNNATQKYVFLSHISSLFDKSVDLLCATCVIPVKVVRKESIKDALHILLSQLLLDDVNELKMVYRSRSVSSERVIVIMKNGNRFLEACQNGSGLIDFLFEESCPLRVSCVKYTTGKGSPKQVISGFQNILPKMNVLSATLEAVSSFMRFMCKKSNSPEMNGVVDEFTTISTLILKENSSKNNIPIQKRFSEKEIQSFLKISSLQTYLTLLSKCVSAAATISSFNNMDNHVFETNKKIRKKRKAVKPLRVFDGIAICMDSYWDGVNESHKCVPPPAA